jgi:uncharacterized protein
MADEEYIILPFNYEKIGEKFLVSNDLGGWAFVDDEELEKIRAHTVEEDPKLFHHLICSDLIFLEGEENNVRQKLKDMFWFVSNGTSLNVIAVTNACNFFCRYCYSPSKNTQNMSLETAGKVVDFILGSPAKTVVFEFSGGEPLLNFPAIKKIVETARELGPKKGKTEVHFGMIHNGTQWDEEKMKFFIENDIGVCFSLDGPKDIHDSNRKYMRGAGSYDDVVKWIKKFRHEGYNRLTAIPVITRESLGRWKEIVDEYISYGFRNVRFKYLGFFGRAAEDWDKLGYTPDEFFDAWSNVIEYMFELNKKKIVVVEDLARIMSRKMFGIDDPGFCELQMPCGAGIGQLAYSPDGGVYTCDEGRMFEEFRLGDVLKPYHEVMRNPALLKLFSASIGFTEKCGDCVMKPFCGFCPLECYKKEGSAVPKIPLNRRCSMYKKMLSYLFRRSEEDPKFLNMLREWSVWKGQLFG